MAVLGSSVELFNLGSWISTQFFTPDPMVITFLCQTQRFAEKKGSNKVQKMIYFWALFRALFLRPLPFFRLRGTYFYAGFLHADQIVAFV